MITSAFTCTGPYAVLIMLGIKRVENRGTLPTVTKGRCAVSCSKSFCKEEFGEFVQWASKALSADEFEMLPAWNDVKDWPGKIVGVCDFAADDKPEKMWDEGLKYWWHLSNVVCFDSPIPCRGNVGFWELPKELSAAVSAADSQAQCVGMKINTREDAERAFRLAAPIAGGNEGFFVLPLDDENCALSAPVLVALGDSSTTAVRSADVFSEVLKAGASSFLVAHNHPSGNPTPSEQDRQLTTELKRFGDFLGVKCVDHLILT